jgi:hypothetical protein
MLARPRLVAIDFHIPNQINKDIDTDSAFMDVVVTPKSDSCASLPTSTTAVVDPTIRRQAVDKLAMARVVMMAGTAESSENVPHNGQEHWQLAKHEENRIHRHVLEAFARTLGPQVRSGLDCFNGASCWDKTKTIGTSDCNAKQQVEIHAWQVAMQYERCVEQHVDAIQRRCAGSTAHIEHTHRHRLSASPTFACTPTVEQVESERLLQLYRRYIDIGLKAALVPDACKSVLMLIVESLHSGKLTIQALRRVERSLLLLKQKVQRELPGQRLNTRTHARNHARKYFGSRIGEQTKTKRRQISTLPTGECDACKNP